MEIRSIIELVQYIKSIRRHHDQELWFRGHASATWDVEPAIQRGYTSNDEKNFTNRFRSRAAIRYERSPGYDDSANWLSIMQHYGLPTRLLDWSRSPLIAGYFSIERYLDDSEVVPVAAKIWILDPFLLNMSEGFEAVTPALDSHTCKEMLVPAFTHSKNWPENNKIRAAMAAETDLRMFVQQGCFTIHSRREPLNHANDCGTYLHSVLIPPEYTRNIADEIKVCGFRKGDIFPDLANLATELKNSYPPGCVAGP